MALRVRLLPVLLGVCSLAASACNGTTGDGDGTNGGETLGGTLDEGLDTFEGGLDEGLEGGENLGCFQYLQACEQDPYCLCYLECAGEGGLPLDCLARCNLAQTPYWAEQFLACFGSELEPDPDPDPDPTGGQEDDGGGTTTGVPPNETDSDDDSG